MNPLVSVLLPVYNANEYLKEAVQSILDQTYTDFELIIINDASTDGSGEVIKSFTDKRIRYVENETNRGLIFNLNKGLELTTGDLVARMDADDISLPQRFEKQVAFLKSNPDISILGTWFNRSDNLAPVEYPVLDQQIKVQLLKENVIAHPSVMFRKSDMQIQQLRYSEQYIYVEDYQLWAAAATKKLKFANLPDVLLQYRIHDNQVSESKRAEQEMMMDEVRLKYAQHIFGEVLNNSRDNEIYLKLYNKKAISVSEYVRLKSILANLTAIKQDVFDQEELKRFINDKLVELAKRYYRVYIPHRFSNIRIAIADNIFMRHLDINNKCIFFFKCLMGGLRNS